MRRESGTENEMLLDQSLAPLEIEEAGVVLDDTVFIAQPTSAAMTLYAVLYRA